MEKITITDSYFVKITITGINSCIVDEVIYYRNKLPMAIIGKFRWFFRYVAALVQVSHPKRKVDLSIGHQEGLQGDEYVTVKSKSLMVAKKGQLKKLQNEIVDDDLFGLNSQMQKEKIEKKKEEISSLERGEFNYYVPPTYINNLKEWINGNR